MAGGWLFGDSEEEDAALAAREDAKRRLQAAYSSQYVVAQQATALAQYAPWMAPGVTLGLAKGGYGPESPVAQQAAQAAVVVQERKRSGGWFSNIGEFVTDAAKGVARTGFAALSAPYEAAQAQFRNIASGDPGRILGGALSIQAPGVDLPGFLGGQQAETLRQTTVGVLGEQALSGDVQAGSGFFVGGEAAATQAERARAAGSILYSTGDQAGTRHAITPGRFLAKFITEPGSGSYRVLSGLTDAAVAVADPTGKGLGRNRAFVSAPAKAPLPIRLAQRVRQADVLAETGLVDGTRRTVLPEVAEQWFGSREGRKVVAAMAEERDFQTLWTATRKQLPVTLTAELADARTPEEVMALLRPAIGVTVRNRPQVGGLGVQVSRRLSGVRAFGQMPSSRLSLDDLDDAVEQLDRFQRNARLPEGVIARNNAALARAQGNADAYRIVVDDVLGAVDGALKQAGTDPKVARRLTKAWSNYHAELTRYFVDEIGENAAVPGAVVDGFGKALPTPHLFAEYLHSSIPLPNARDIRTATSRFRRLYELPGVKLTTAAGDFLMQDVWKPMALLRGAWTVRVVGEEQVRMGASGLNSLVAHPMSALAWVSGRKGAKGLAGDALEDAAEFGKAISQRGAGGWRDNVIRTRHKVLVRSDDEEFARSWADELAQLHADPVARRVAAGGLGEGDRTPGIREGLPGIKDWFFDGAGRRFREQMAEASGRDDLLTRAGADAYVDSVRKRVGVKTADNPELLAAAATGRLRDAALSEAGRPAKAALARLDELALEGVGPQVVKGDLLVAGKQGGSEFAARYDRAVETMFNTLMTRPTNYLSRSSAFKQFYWRRAEELTPFLDDTAQQAAIANARAAGLKDVARRMEGVRKQGVAGTLSIADADVVAKGFGLDETRKLLYSMTEKSQWSDSLRLVFPFGEAWKEVLTRWATIGVENPGALRKAQVGVQGARGQGFFHTNEQGEEMFSYPGSEWITSKALGLPNGVAVPLEGRVAGLNLFSSSVIPGFGPVVTIPAGHLIPDRPEWDGVRDILMPFGDPDTSGGFAESFLPPWLQKFRIALDKGSPEQDRQYANTVMELARALAASGEYPTNTPEQVDRLLTKARSTAKGLYLIRGGAQFVAPSAPSPTVMAADKEGRMIVADLLVKDYRTMQETLGYDEAVGAFLAKYGEDALLYMQPKTRALADVPATKEALDFVRRNPDLAEKYPLVYGYFLPQDGEFDFMAYRKQIERGTREQVSPEQAVALANARVANWIYQQAKTKAGPSPGQPARDWLYSVKTALQREYPGYGDYTGLTERATTEQRVEQITAAVANPKIAGTPAGKAVATYLTARRKAQQAAEAQGLRGYTSAKTAEPIRRWLRAIGEALVAETPEFAPAWERLFSNEVDVAGDEAAA